MIGPVFSFKKRIESQQKLDQAHSKSPHINSLLHVGGTPATLNNSIQLEPRNTLFLSDATEVRNPCSLTMSLMIISTLSLPVKNSLINQKQPSYDTIYTSAQTGVVTMLLHTHLLIKSVGTKLFTGELLKRVWYREECKKRERSEKQ